MTADMLFSLIDRYSAAITCFCFMGGDAAPIEIMELAAAIKSRFPQIKTAWYSGKESLPEGFDTGVLDFLKLGPYVAELGGLKSPDTNQALYRFLPDGNMERIMFH